MHFMQPGALHRARWMARVIYAIKISLFCSQFVMKKGKVANWPASSDILPLPLAYMFVYGLLLMSQFGPANDLEFIKRLVTYEDTCKSISKAASTAFSRHVWYLSEIMISLALFDPVTFVREERHG